MYSYLRSQRTTLKMLSWKNFIAFKYPLWGMPGFTKLKLEYECLGDDYYESVYENQQYDGQHIEVPFQSTILYSEMFPNLEELILSSYEHNVLEFQSMFFAPQFPFSSLQRLTIHFRGMNADLLTAISTTFPRIKFLDINDCYTLCWDEQWNFYSALWTAEFSSTIEELVIWFPLRDWRQFELHSLLLGIPEIEIEHEFSSGPGNASIYNYTNLKSVELQLSRGLGQALSIFGKLEKPEHLHIGDKNLVSSPTIQEFKKLFNRSPQIQSLPSTPMNPIEKVEQL